MDRKQEELTQREQIDQTLLLLEWNLRVGIVICGKTFM